MPLVYIAFPSVAQPVCKPPMAPGKARVRGCGGGLGGIAGAPV